MNISAESFMDLQAHQINALPPNGGSGTYSYSKNSYFQKQSSSVEESKIEEEIHKKLDVKKLACASNMIIRVVDLGCATGPNTFMNAQNVLEAIKNKYQSQCQNSAIMPEFHVFFNDQPSNDFNTLFTSLPHERNYYASGVPGSFYDRLFPNSSLHFASSTYALHFLSKSPDVLQDINNPAWNKGRIHYTSASKAVVDAYAAQFAKDAGNFLDARAAELVPGGMLVIVMQGVPNGMPYSDIINGMLYDSMGSILIELSKEGKFDESQVDYFNLPFYAPSPEEMTKLIEMNSRFSIERMELTNPAPWLKSTAQVIPEWIIHVRAAMEAIFIRHFGNEVTHEMFQRLTKHMLDKSEMLEAKYRDKIQFFVVLKRIE
ncbi:farnesoic acid carboxyl-O-methyltransferase-like [Abrus precatorius]|uniref:Farnesoic acid carboxyl-O-methyltransferase-like n=1 Tax=Abrus precatorius TaxID=3816 RepID=A0A8B8M0N9_ABRPR|nr:farnesoic acid carboxyl-O-methyltransferase-like [Abrus precatorius]